MNRLIDSSHARGTKKRLALLKTRIRDVDRFAVEDPKKFQELKRAGFPGVRPGERVTISTTGPMCPEQAEVKADES